MMLSAVKSGERALRDNDSLTGMEEMDMVDLVRHLESKVYIPFTSDVAIAA